VRILAAVRLDAMAYHPLLKSNSSTGRRLALIGWASSLLYSITLFISARCGKYVGWGKV